MKEEADEERSSFEVFFFCILFFVLLSFLSHSLSLARAR